MLSDLRHAIRLLIKDRSFTVTALLTLALCIGANTAIFSVVQSVLLRPLPVPDADRLVLVLNGYPNAGAPRAAAAVPDYFDRLTGVTTLEEQSLYRRTGVTLGAVGGAERLVAVQATPSLFRLTGARPVVGSVFSESDGEAGAVRRVLLSHAMWLEKFGGDAGVVGREVRLSGNVHLVAGVLPADFTVLWNDIDVWLPTQFTAEEKSDNSRHNNSWTMIGRLKEGASLTQVQQQLDALKTANDERFPQFRQILKDAGYRTDAYMLQADLVRELRPVLYLLWGGVAFVLLIGCVNIANLVMIRSSGRAREMATRHAIGASHGRLGRQMLSETMLVSTVGGALGIMLGWWALSAVPTLGLDELPRGHEIHMDLTTVAVAFGMTVLVGLVIGLVPVLRLRTMNVNSTLRDEGRGGTVSHGTNLLRRGLATAQIALAFVLLIGAGLMFASFREVLKIDPGFTPAGVITAQVTLPATAYPDDQALETVSRRLVEAAQSIAGVEHAGVTSTLPMSGDFNSSVIFAEGYVTKPGESLLSPAQTSVSHGYFEAMDTPLVRGRLFTQADTMESPLVIIVDEQLAEKFWPGQDPIGRRMYPPTSMDDPTAITPETRFFTVVGVVKNVQITGLASSVPMVGAYYFSQSQSPNRSLTLALRATTSPESVVNTLRKKVAEINPELPVYSVKTMMELMEESLISRRVPMLIAAAFAVVALFLSAIGVYGVLAYQVSQRRREIGIRMALGSTAREVFRLVLADGLKIAGAGLALGLVGTFFVGEAMKSQLYEVAPNDPAVIAMVAGILTVVAIAATLIPARRAARVNPLTALGDQ
jgi:predicted permease